MAQALRDAIGRNNLDDVKKAITEIKNLGALAEQALTVALAQQKNAADDVAEMEGYVAEAANRKKRFLSDSDVLFDGETPLTEVVRLDIPVFLDDREGIIKALLDAGADPNVPNGNGNTPLYIAVEHEKVDYVRLLLENGAAVMSGDKVASLAHKKANRPRASQESKIINELILAKQTVPIAEPAQSLHSPPPSGAVALVDLPAHMKGKVSRQGDDDSSSDEDEDDDDQGGGGKKHKRVHKKNHENLYQK